MSIVTRAIQRADTHFSEGRRVNQPPSNVAPEDRETWRLAYDAEYDRLVQENDFIAEDDYGDY